MSNVITVEYRGRKVTLLQLSELTDINECTLASRYRKGDRGEHLVRPLYDGKRDANDDDSSPANADPRRRQIQEDERSRRQDRRQQNETKRKEAIDAHRAAFSKPLIASDLLSEQERAEIRANVVGRQRWYSMTST